MRPSPCLPSDTIVAFTFPRLTQGHHPHHHWEGGGVTILSSVWSSVGCFMAFVGGYVAGVVVLGVEGGGSLCVPLSFRGEETSLTRRR